MSGLNFQGKPHRAQQQNVVYHQHTHVPDAEQTYEDYTEYEKTSGERTPIGVDEHNVIHDPMPAPLVLEEKLQYVEPITAHQKSIWWEEHERYLRIQEERTRQMQQENERKMKEWNQKRNEQMDSMRKKIDYLESEVNKDPLRPSQRYQESPPEPDLKGIPHAKTVFMAMIEDLSPAW